MQAESPKLHKPCFNPYPSQSQYVLPGNIVWGNNAVNPKPQASYKQSSTLYKILPGMYVLWRLMQGGAVLTHAHTPTQATIQSAPFTCDTIKGVPDNAVVYW